MKKLIEFFTSQGLFADLLTLFIVGVGLVSLFSIQREAFPNVQYDMVSITTIFPAASPEETERLITSPLEQDLKEVDGVKKLTSFSLEGRSLIIIQFDPDQTTQAQGKSDVQEVVDSFSDLPEGSEDPVVKSLESKHQPVVDVSVGGGT